MAFTKPRRAVGNVSDYRSAPLTVDAGVTSLILALSHTLVEIDLEIISMDILHPSADLFKNGCCQF